MSGTDWITINYVQDAAQLSPASLSFADEPLLVQSAPQTVTLTNTAEVSLGAITVSVTGEFQLINNCPSTLAAHASCSLSITFTPAGLGIRAGAVTVRDDWAGSATSPQTVHLTGTGT
jgi:hypothetical protein